MPAIGARTLEEVRKLEISAKQGGRDPRNWHRQGNWRKQLLDHLQQTDRLPCLYFAFSRRGCEERAHENIWRELLSPDERQAAVSLFDSLVERYDAGTAAHAGELRALVSRGISFHHAGMLPLMKEIVERRFTTGCIKLLFATETFALGVNMPARCVVFDSIRKFDGVRRAPMKAREYQQMAGRAGRRGMDNKGFVYANIEWPFNPVQSAVKVIEGRVEPINSQFNLSYSTLLNLYERLHDDIYRACENSFANFLAQAGHGSTRASQQKPYSRMMDQVRRRLELLRKLGYINAEGRLTPRGDFAKRINGYELQVAEAYFRDVYRQLDEMLLAIAITATVFESRRGEWYERIDRRLVRHLKSRMGGIVSDIRHMERQAGIETLTKEVDFRVSSVAMLWMEGASLEELASRTTAAEGDIVRALRLTIQLIRQIERALPPDGDEPFRARLLSALSRLKRDEVDAEKQLMAG